MNLIRQGENQLLEANTLNGGQLRIGASDTICRYYLVSYLKDFHRRYPNVHIKVTNQTSIACAKLLESGQVDFAITNYPNSGLSNTPECTDHPGNSRMYSWPMTNTKS